MLLRDKVNGDIATAMKAKDAARLSALRMMKAAITNKGVEKGHDLDDAEVLQVLASLVKQRRDSIEQFSKAGSRVVLYSIGTMMWATRVWWMLRALGFDGAAVLDGGLDRWQAEGRPIETGEPRGYPPATFTPRPRPGRFVDKTEVRAAIGDPRTVTVNALGPQSHRGLESRYGRPGRVPGSVNVPAASLVDPATKRFVAPADALAAFAAAGIARDKRVIAYCGGGISATIDLFMLHQLGFDDLTLYDGSMGEWAKDPGLPIETG
jgi:thiosulfate/3-mercaptopyruvate sulfurtransferase